MPYRLAIAHYSVDLISSNQGWVVGLEPTTSRTTIWRANQLHHTHHIYFSNEPGGIRTLDLRLRRPLLYPAELWTHISHPCVSHMKAGDGNRTHVSSLEGWCSTIELHPHTKNIHKINRGDRIRTCDPLLPKQVL